MASNKEIIDWFLENSESLNLKVEQGTWVKEWISNFYDFSVEIEISGNKFTGRGIDIDINIAFIKACIEATERVICFENGIYSTGVAGHVSNEAAQVNAKNELLERDSFLCHYLTHTPWLRIDTPKGSLINYESITKKLKAQNIEIGLYQLYSSKGLSSALCISRTKENGLILGLSTSNHLDAAVEKALCECLVNTISHLDGTSHDPLSLNEFKTMKNIKSLEHFRYNLAEDSFLRIEGLLDGKVLKTLAPIDIKYQKLKPQHEALRDCPAVFFKALSSNIQNILYGEIESSCLNLKRLSDFKCTEVNFEAVEKRIHPLG